MWTLTLVGLILLPAVHSQVVNVTIFTESQCPYCTRLLREQIWPFYVNRPGIMNLQSTVHQIHSAEPEMIHLQTRTDEFKTPNVLNCLVKIEMRSTHVAS